MSEANKEVVMTEVKDALGRNDFIKLQRIFSRLSSIRIEMIIFDEFIKAYDKSDEVGKVLTTRFCKQAAEFREKKSA